MSKITFCAIFSLWLVVSTCQSSSSLPVNTYQINTTSGYSVGPVNSNGDVILIGGGEDLALLATANINSGQIERAIDVGFSPSGFYSTVLLDSGNILASYLDNKQPMFLLLTPKLTLLKTWSITQSPDQAPFFGCSAMAISGTVLTCPNGTTTIYQFTLDEFESEIQFSKVFEFQTPKSTYQAYNLHGWSRSLDGDWYGYGTISAGPLFAFSISADLTKVNWVWSFGVFGDQTPTAFVEVRKDLYAMCGEEVTPGQRGWVALFDPNSSIPVIYDNFLGFKTQAGEGIGVASISYSSFILYTPGEMHYFDIYGDNQAKIKNKWSIEVSSPQTEYYSILSFLPQEEGNLLAFSFLPEGYSISRAYPGLLQLFEMDPSDGSTGSSEYLKSNTITTDFTPNGILTKSFKNITEEFNILEANDSVFDVQVYPAKNVITGPLQIKVAQVPSIFDFESLESKVHLS